MGLLVGVLRGVTTQRGIWRLLAVHGLWSFPRFPVTDQALYNRLQRLAPATWAAFFDQVTAALAARLPGLTAQSLAPFAPRIVALDHTVLDAVLRKVKAFRDCRPGDLGLIPGTLACAFDIRRQLWLQVLYRDVVQDPWDDFSDFIQTLEPGSLLLFDLGFFSFEWFDWATENGYWFVSRLRKRTTYQTLHVFYESRNQATGAGVISLSDRLVFLGNYAASRAGKPVRLVQITLGATTYSYVTNVLDPCQLPAWQLDALYRRRWDIEGGFNLVKTFLGMAELWSGHRGVLTHQVFATFVTAQIILAFRNEVAQRAGCDLQEISVRLLVEWVPRLAQMGRDPLEEIVLTGREAGYIRPFRGKPRNVPQPDPEEYAPAPEIPTRQAHFPNREAYLSRQKELRAAKRASGQSTYRPHGNKSIP